jgi:glycerol-3-phosphate dehydrogenase
MFGVPWHNRVILGTTDVSVKEFVLEPKALNEEVEFILETAGRYLAKKPERKDVLCVFAGLRPLAAPKNDADGEKTKEISRSHKLMASASGLVTITGGKWTTYRRMAEETVSLALKMKALPFRKCQTKKLKIHGYLENPDRNDHMYIYGADREKILELQKEKKEYAEKLHPDLEFTVGEVVWAVRKEMARTVDDVLARRVRILYVDARASLKVVPKVAAIMAEELGKDKAWEERQIRDYTEMAQAYVLQNDDFENQAGHGAEASKETGL